MMRSGLLTLLTLLAALIPSLVNAQAAKPNIVFIFSDDHSLQTIGAYGGRLSEFCRQQAVTPNIDRLAAGGALFPNSFCGNSLCSPSRASILTGLHSGANGVTHLDQSVRQDVWTFPGALREVGYRTAVLGKWHLGTTPPGTDDHAVFPGQGSYWNPVTIGPTSRVTHTGYATDILTDLGLAWLKQRDKTKPFMLMLQHKAPHRPWQPPARYANWLADVKIPEPDTLFDDYAGRGTAARIQKMEIGRDMTLASDLKVQPAGKKTPETQSAYATRNEAFLKADLKGEALTRWKYQEYMKDYLRCIKAVDDSVGQMLDGLKDEGLEDNTVVIYASDQGFYNGEHGWFDKRWIYEESIHMPLIVRWPGVVKAGSRPAAFVQNIDYAATFVDLAGGQVPTGLHGRSLVPILRGETPSDWRKAVYYHYYDPGHGVTAHYGLRTDRFTLANFYPLGEWELYDNEKDPQQMRSVHADPAYASHVTELNAELERLRSAYEPGFDPQNAGKRAKGRK